DVIDIAAAGGDLLQFVGGAFKFLDDKRAETAAAVRFGDRHENVAVGRVVVIEEAAGGEDLAVLLEKKFGAFVEVLRGNLGAIVGHGAAEDDTRLLHRRDDFVVEEDGFGGDVFGVGVEHDVKE